MPDIGLTIPFYNEERSAGPVARETLAALRRSGLTYEVVFVTDGSTDGTVAALREAVGTDPNVTILDGPAAQGYGAAVLRGLSQLQADIVGWTDGDGQVPTSTFLDIRAAMLREGAALGMGIRMKRQDGLVRWFASHGYNWLMRRMLGVHFHDVNAKPKLVERSLLREISPRSTDWFIDTELVVGAVVRNATIVRVPVPFLAREHGASKVGSSILREYWRNLRGYRRRLGAEGFLPRRAATPVASAPAKGDDRRARPEE